MSLLLCDGTYEGFLSAVFEATAMRPHPDGILLRAPQQIDFLSEPRFVPTDAARAARVHAAIRNKLSDTTEDNIRHCIVYGERDLGTVLYRYLQKGWEVGRKLDACLTDDDVLTVMKCARRSAFEVHRLHGMIRFTLTRGEVYYAPITPDNDILELLAPHFMERFYDQPSAIHDRARGKILLFYRGQSEVRRVPLEAEMPEQHPYDVLVTDLWKAFFRSIAVESRVNLDFQRNFMPRRYWKNMPEMQGKVWGSVNAARAAGAADAADGADAAEGADATPKPEGIPAPGIEAEKEG